MRSEPVVRGSLRRLRAVLTAADPGLDRLRSAGTTVATLLVAVGALYGLVTLWGQPVTAAVLGVVVAMIASIAVTEPATARRAASIALLVPSAAATASLAAALSSRPVIADAGFVVVAIGAVFLRLLGPRGMAMGMIGFIAYFLALFVQLTVAHLPVAIVAAAVGALVAFGVGTLLRPRHPDRDLRRMIAALGIRAGSALEALSGELDGPTAGSRRTDRLRSRLAASGEVALLIEQRLDAAQEPLVRGADNDELSVRIFDFQLGLEHLAGVAARVGAAEQAAPARAEVVDALHRAGGALRDGTGDQAAARADLPAAGIPAGQHGDAPPTSELALLMRALHVTLTGWLGIVDPQPEDAGQSPGPATDEAGDSSDEEPAEDDEPPPGRWADTARQAVQVGLAAALAIVVGELISPTRWFWAAIAAFVVFTGTATRGETLSKGWQRVLGTLAGVVAGVVVAALVGGHTLVAVGLIVLSVFLAIYVMRISSGWMIFFITTMLALLYGLLGRFSIGLLLVRLEETAAGAAIGVLVSFLVFPNSTRAAARRGAKDFLTDLAELLDHLAPKLTGRRGAVSSAQADASALRTSFEKLTSTARPLTDGLAGLANRSGYRRTLRILGACEHHARVLTRLADTVAGTGTTPELGRMIDHAVHEVRNNVDAVGRAVDGDLAAVTVHPADDALDALDHAADSAAAADRHGLEAVGRHLRAIDLAVCGLAVDRGARARPLQAAR